MDQRGCEDSAVIRISVAGFELSARLEEKRSPRTVAFFRTMLPYDSKMIQARWSGQAAWIPMGDFDVGDLGPEDPTSYPAPGELLLSPGGVSHSPAELSSDEDVALSIDVLAGALARL